jgi:hypothetical protein
MSENRCDVVLEYKCGRNPAKECTFFISKKGEPLSCVSLGYYNHCRNEHAKAAALEQWGKTRYPELKTNYSTPA